MLTALFATLLVMGASAKNMITPVRGAHAAALNVASVNQMNYNIGAHVLTGPASANSKKVYVSGKISIGGTAVDNYSHGTALSGNDITDIIQAQIDANVFPIDSTGIYFFLNSA
eukprot:jgi/Hompol1/3815/HPOL_006758-RA